MELTVKRLREMMDYDQVTGIFRWRVRPNGRVKVGDIAGTVGKDGYRSIKTCGRKYAASRLAWFYMTGAWPNGEVDHKNGIHDANWFLNLRDATRSGNQQNQRRAHRNSKTGMLGANPKRGRFRAQIQTDGKVRHLGTFDTAEAAHAAYVAAKRRLHEGCMI